MAVFQKRCKKQGCLSYHIKLVSIHIPLLDNWFDPPRTTVPDTEIRLVLVSLNNKNENECKNKNVIYSIAN